MSGSDAFPSDGLARLSELVERVSSAYADRHGIHRDRDWYMLKLHEELGELTQAYIGLTGRSRRSVDSEEAHRDLGNEMADCLCHVLLLAKFHGVDLEEAIERKWLRYLPDE